MSKSTGRPMSASTGMVLDLGGSWRGNTQFPMYSVVFTRVILDGHN